MPLTYILNLSIRTKAFPEEWKAAQVTAIYKDGKRDEPSNYRPISVLPTCSKLLERVIHTQLYAFLKASGLLSKAQSGFRAGHSTVTCMIDFLHAIYQGIDNGETSGVLFLDLRKAFDTVDHYILLRKLRSIGLKESAVTWFRSYLTNRMQSVKYNGEVSDPLPITCGVPQGSILGPLLFIIYVNDMPDAFVGPKLNLYADDTAISVRSSDPQQLQLLLQVQINTAADWLQRNRLSLNVSKTKIMVFGTSTMVNRAMDIEVMYGQDSIELVDRFKYLGMILDNTLSFKYHVDYVCRKIIPRLKMLSKMRSIANESICLYLYKTLMLPLFDYGDVIYDCIFQQDSEKLQKLQNAALRIIYKKPHDTPIVELHRLGKIYRLEDRRHYHVCHQTYKCLNDLAPKHLGAEFIRPDAVHSIQTRFATEGNLTVPQVQLQLCTRDFYVRAPFYWNLIDYDVKTSDSLQSFKNALFRSNLFDFA